jgi:hypothetical protein
MTGSPIFFWFVMLMMPVWGFTLIQSVGQWLGAW